MARLGNIQEFEKRKDAARQNTGQPSSMPAAPPVSAPTAESKPLQTANTTPSQTSTAPSVMGAAQVNNPYLERMTWKNTGIVPMPGQGAYRQEALRDMNEAEFAQNQEKMNATSKEYWIEQMKKDPLNSYVYANYMFASDETPEQKRKRERREQLGEVFNNLGNLIGNAANLYYTHRGGQYIDLNTANEKHRARMQQLKDKQDALDEQRKNIILNAKLGEIQAQRAERAAKAKTDAEAKAADLKHKRDLTLKQIENAYKLGQIDAETKAKLTEQIAKAASERELEAFKQQGRIALKTTPGYGEDDIVESFTDANGVVWTRTKPFSKAEKAEAFESLPIEVQQMFTVEQYDDDKNVTSRRIDYDGALGYAIKHNYINDPDKRGFKKQGGNSGLISIDGLGGKSGKSDKRPKI